jgi:hypothetical protein
VIALGMVRDAFDRQRGQPVLQLAQVARAADLAAVGHPEHELAESEMRHHEPAELVQQGR